MLTGSMAMVRYTVFRQTADIDIIFEFGFQNKEEFINPLEPDYYVPHQSLSRTIETNKMFNVIHQDTAFKIDCVLKKSTYYQKNAFANREKTDYYGRAVWVISKEDLILSKLWWAKDSRSEMQLRDVKNLMRAGFDSDATPEIEKMQFELMMEKTSNERIALSCEMFMSDREMFLASLPKDLSEKKVKKQLYFRTYGENLPDAFFKE